MANRSKIETFIGFSIRARALACGSNTIATQKRVYLIILCSSASENTKKIAQKYCNKFRCDLLLCKKPLEDIVYKQNCKLVALTDKNLAKAILDNQDENFSVYSGGNGL